MLEIEILSTSINYRELLLREILKNKKNALSQLRLCAVGAPRVSPAVDRQKVDDFPKPAFHPTMFVEFTLW
jgi:hypothetical protein